VNYGARTLQGVALLLGVAAPIALAVVFDVRRDWLLRRRQRGTGGGAPSSLFGRAAALLAGWLLPGLSTATRTAFLLTFVPGILLFVLAGVLAPAGTQWTRSLGAPATLLIGFGLISPVTSLCALGQRATRIPLMIVLLLLCVLSSYWELNDNHRLRFTWRDKPVTFHTAMPAPELGEGFHQWLRHRPDLKQYARFERDKAGKGHWTGSYPVFFVAAEGGGIRAAYQAAGALAACQDADPRFAAHVFALSGVSGGSVGEAVFAGLCRRYRPDGTGKTALPLPPPTGNEFPDSRGHPWGATVDRILAYDMLSPTIAATLSPDLVQRFLPFACGRLDRGRALETALETAYLGVTGGDDMTVPFYSFHGDGFADFAGGSVPALFFNTTSVETGDRMIVASLWSFDQSGEQTTVPYFATLAEVSRHVDPRFSSAACLSARFPIVSSAGWLPVTEDRQTGAPIARPVKRRFVDGGYCENSGLATVDDILASLRPWQDKGQPKTAEEETADAHLFPPWYPVIVRIGNEGVFRYDGGKKAISEDSLIERARPASGDPFEDLLSPLRAVSGAWGARTRLGINQTKVRANENVTARRPLAEFIYRDEEGYPALPLGWQLSTVSRGELRRQTGVPEWERWRDGRTDAPDLDHPFRPTENNAAALRGMMEALSHTLPAPK
jgi:hypothetical protein